MKRNKWLVLLLLLLFSCGKNHLEVIAKKEIYSSTSVRESSINQIQSFNFIRTESELVGDFTYILLKGYEGIGLTFTNDNHFKTQWYSCTRNQKCLYKSTAKWYFQNEDIILKTGLFGLHKYRFKLIKYPKVYLLVSEEKWKRFERL